MEKNKENKNDWLLDYSRDVTSQTGEDGIIEKIFEIILPKDPWCVDVGAWNGKHRSNVYNLLVNKGWSGVMIETDKVRFAELKDRYKDNNKVYCINKHVSFEGDQTLDKILSEAPIPKNFSLLNIDIDGNDYHLWDSLKVYRPQVVCIEFNPTVPNSISFVQEKNMSVNQGNSLKALVELGKKKGYELVSVTKLNALFVDVSYFKLFEIEDNSLNELNKETKNYTTLFHLYDGTVVLDGCDTILWHGIKMNIKKMQPIPSFFRTFPSVMSKPKSFLFKVWRKLHNLK